MVKLSLMKAILAVIVDGGGQTRRACADNHNIVLHTVAGDGFCHGGSCMFVIDFKTGNYTTQTVAYQIKQCRLK